MNYYLGLDGGGTRTECVVINQKGHLEAQAKAGPSNPLRVGYPRAFDALREAAMSALKAANLKTKDVRGVCAGVAGAGRPHVAQKVSAFVADVFPRASTHVATDLEIALEAAVGAGPGVVLIAGTGSSAFGRNRGGELARAGGHGPWIGDEGSAYDIGRNAVRSVIGARDAGARPTILEPKILAALNCLGLDELIERIAAGPDDAFPRIFPVVVQAAENGDASASRILVEAARALAAIAVTVINRLGLKEQEFTLAKSGGVFGRSSLLDSEVDALVSRAASGARITALSVPPAVGAARLAQRLTQAEFGGAAHGA